MRYPILFLMLAATAVPASSQRLGERTTSPAEMAAGMNAISVEDEMQALIAAADSHPLGSLRNPVRVAGPQGERAYLARLRCADGTSPRIGERSTGGIGAFGSVVATYDIACTDRPEQLVFDMYQEEYAETRAPAGFVLAR